MIDLKSAMIEEASIWKVVYGHREFSDDVIAFKEPLYPEVFHWNLTYSFNLELLPNKILSEVRKFYEADNCKGHLVTDPNLLNASEASKNEYFFYDKEQAPSHLNISKRIELKEINDLSVFCDVISLAVPLENNFRNYFLKKMELIRKEIISRFFAATHDGEYCGCWSFFDSEDGNTYLMNFALRPDFQGLGLAHDLINLVIKSAHKNIYTHSFEDSMRNKILPKSGFKSLGTVNFTPLANLT